MPAVGLFSMKSPCLSRGIYTHKEKSNIFFIINYFFSVLHEVSRKYPHFLHAFWRLHLGYGDT